MFCLLLEKETMDVWVNGVVLETAVSLIKIENILANQRTHLWLR